MSILVIDSASGVLPRIKAIFEEHGLNNVALARTAADAMVILNEKSASSDDIEEISLIVVDGKLDDMDGFELCRNIRKLPNMEHVYILLLVSSTENKTAIEKARHSGANDFAVKPYDQVDFVKHLLVYAHRKTVLLVEDDPVVIKLVSAILHKKHVEVIVASDGMKAYNLINIIGPPKLVLLDIGLPGMSGIKLIEHIRNKNIWRKTPVLMLTGSVDVMDVKSSLGAGANEYIVKPFQIPDFTKRIEKFLGDIK
jgi:DNA-binding response OmpR family regulator